MVSISHGRLQYCGGAGLRSCKKSMNCKTETTNIGIYYQQLMHLHCGIYRTQMHLYTQCICQVLVAHSSDYHHLICAVPSWTQDSNSTTDSRTSCTTVAIFQHLNSKGRVQNFFILIDVYTMHILPCILALVITTITSLSFNISTPYIR